MIFRDYLGNYSTTNVRRGIVRGKNLSKELDCCTVVLTQVDKMEIRSFDLIELTNESNNLEYWFIARKHRKTVSFNPVKYDYTVDLMSLTKYLEKIILPNLAITNIGQNRTILEYVDEIFNYYFNSNNYSDKKCIFSENLINVFDDVICPECTFTEPTLRELLDYLFGFKNYFAKLDFVDGNFVLDCLDLNPNSEPIPSEYILYIEESENADEYITQLEHTLTDVIGQHPITEFHRLKSDSYLFNTETAKLLLHHKIYDIKRAVVIGMPFQIRAYMSISGNSNIVDGATIYFNSNNADGSESGGLYRYISGVDIDISDYFVIDEIFQTLKTLPQGSFNSIDESKAKTNYSNNSLRWSRGSKVIDNFHYYQTKTNIWTSSDDEAITYAIKCALYLKINELLKMATYVNENGNTVTYGAYSANDFYGINYDFDWKTGWQNLIFKVEYIPYIDAKLKIQKSNSFRYLISAIDNSTNAMTDISNFLDRSFEKNKQLANPTLLLYGRSLVSKTGTYDPVFKLGQYYIEDNSKYLLTSLEFETKDNCILYKGILTKDYSNRNIYTEINREKRYFSLPDKSQAVIRKEVLTHKYTVSLSNTYDDSILMLVKPFDIGCFVSKISDTEYIEGYIPATTISKRNLIIHTAIFEDNIVYANRIGELKNGGYEMEQLRYTNDNGESKKTTIEFKCISGKDVEVFLNGEKPSNEGEAFIGSTDTFTYLIHKDSREQLCLTGQNMIVNNPYDTNITINESYIGELMNANSFQIICGNSVVLLFASNESKNKFGMPIHDILETNISYPCNLSVMLASGEECISIKNYNGESIVLKRHND